MTVLFHSTTARDDALDKLKDTTPTTPDGNKLRLDKTKTQRQLDRNSSLYHAKDLLSKHPNNANKHVEIIWKDRTVEVDRQPTFNKNSRDVTGTFTPTYATLNF